LFSFAILESLWK